MARKRFSAFFAELRRVFVERDDVLKQIALALLAREHVLMTGPPGTAKSRLAAAVIGRVVDDESLEPSVFARQFTESTVQTDLVGPINFKTLTETGRTEHFTDEGILGAVHAFLDEVLDGRDMLLRSTLNLLHERELKQGATVTRGHIECAVMTTNRYLSEVIEQSRETLLAFVDRVAFLSFVPKGFASTEGLRRVLMEELGSSGRGGLHELLTIQDVDVLQQMVDSLVVSAPVCERLGELLQRLDAEQEAAVRADPTYVPTRYLSTRTAVRLGRLLRAICVLDWATDHPERSLEVDVPDLESLRLAVLLAGPNPKDLDALAKRETNPRERRQLEIMMLERDMFQRCFAALKPLSPSEKKPVDKARPQATPPKAAKGTPPVSAVALADAARAAADRSAVDPEVQTLLDSALRSGLALSPATAEDPLATAARLATLADELESKDPTRRPVARWLRGRALLLFRGHATLSLADLTAATLVAAKPPSSLAEFRDQAAAILARMEETLGLRERLRSGGAEDEAPQETQQAVEACVSGAEDRLARLWDEALRQAAGAALAKDGIADLGRALESLGPVLAAIDDSGSRLAAAGSKSSLKARVVGARLSPLIAASFERFDARQRRQVADQVESVLEVLASAGLSGAIRPVDLLAWAALALLRTETTPARKETRPQRLAVSYRTVRNARERVSIGFVLSELALRLVPNSGDDAARVPAAVTALVASLPGELKQRASAADLARIDAPLGVLEAWFASVREVIGGAPGKPALESEDARAFYEIVGTEMALSRFALEATLVTALFEEARPGAERTLARLTELARGARALASDAMDERARRHWDELLSRPVSAT